MKKLALLVFVAVIGIAVGANAQVTEKSSVKTKGDTTVEKSEVKAGNIKAKEEVKTTPTSTETKAEVKGKGGKIEKEQTTTAAGTTGETKIHIKKGALANMKIDYDYYQKGNDYILEYTIKDVQNKDFNDRLAKLGLTPEQIKLLKPGVVHTYTATRDISADVQTKVDELIFADIKSTLVKK